LVGDSEQSSIRLSLALSARPSPESSISGVGRGAGLLLGPSPGLLPFLLGGPAGGLATSSERLDTIMRAGRRRESSQRKAQREGNKRSGGRKIPSARTDHTHASEACTARTNAHTHARTKDHTHARTLIHARTRMHACPHIHTHSQESEHIFSRARAWTGWVGRWMYRAAGDAGGIVCPCGILPMAPIAPLYYREFLGFFWDLGPWGWSC